MSSTPAKTTPARTNIAPVAPKTASNVPVTVTTAKSPFSTTSSNASSKTGVVAAPKTAPKSVAAKNIESATSFSDIQRSAANTGSTAAYLSPEEKKVLLLINLVRADGGTFLKEYVDKYIKTNLATEEEF